MGRHLDFKRPSKPSGSASGASFSSAPIQPHPAPTHHLPRKRRRLWPLILLIIGLGLASLALYEKYQQEISSPAATPSPTASSSPTTATESNVFTSNDGKLIVQLYDSGAGEEVVEAVAIKLREKGFEVAQLGKSQFTYDKTYISHSAEYAERSKEIGALLADRVVSYKESQVEGIFDVLIYVGKQ